jgi:benzodiazapine receptor
VVLLLASTLELTRRTWRLDRAAGTALLPYAGWTSFATALSAEIARRNRPRA